MDTSNSRNKGRKKTGRENPKMVFFISLALTLACFAALIFTASVIGGAADKSSYTQAHGLSRSGIVTGVTNNDGRDPSSDLAIRLADPVNGHATTTAHMHPQTTLKPGAAVQVLVDPQDPGYAEFPGHPYLPKSTAQVSTAALLACLAVFAFGTAWWGRVWRRQRKSVRAARSTEIKDADVTP